MFGFIIGFDAVTIMSELLRKLKEQGVVPVCTGFITAFKYIVFPLKKAVLCLVKVLILKNVSLCGFVIWT